MFVLKCSLAVSVLAPICEAISCHAYACECDDEECSETPMSCGDGQVCYKSTSEIAGACVQSGACTTDAIDCEFATANAVDGIEVTCETCETDDCNAFMANSGTEDTSSDSTGTETGMVAGVSTTDPNTTTTDDGILTCLQYSCTSCGDVGCVQEETTCESYQVCYSSVTSVTGRCNEEGGCIFATAGCDTLENAAPTISGASGSDLDFLCSTCDTDNCNAIVESAGRAISCRAYTCDCGDPLCSPTDRLCAYGEVCYTMQNTGDDGVCRETGGCIGPPYSCDLLLELANNGSVCDPCDTDRCNGHSEETSVAGVFSGAADSGWPAVFVPLAAFSLC